MERPSNGSVEEDPEVEAPTYVLDLCLSNLILIAKSDHSSGSFADVNDGGRSIPAAGVFCAG